MEATVDGFSYGIVTPVASFLMACLGGALGLRCISRSLHAASRARVGWLTLASAALGSGIWTTHFIAMMGFTVEMTSVDYDAVTTFASLGVAVLMVGSGVFIVGYRGATGRALFTGGTVTGLGIASMHFLGMAGMRLGGQVGYNTLTVSASVLIAVLASIASFWAARDKGLWWSLGASLAMGLAVTGMHYVAMAAVHVKLEPVTAGLQTESPVKLLVPMMIGPFAFLVLAGAFVLFDPLVVAGSPLRHIPAPRRDEDVRPFIPAARHVPPEPTRTGARGPHRSRTPQDW